MKKLFALILATLMIASLAVTVFADFVPSIGDKPAPDLSDDGLDCGHDDSITITPVSDPNASAALKDAYNSLKNGEDELPTDISNPVIRDLFEVDGNCDDADGAVDGDGTIEITLDVGLDPDQPFDVFGYVNGAWRKLPAKNNGDGTISVTMEEFGILALVAGASRMPATGDAQDNHTAWMIAMIVSLALIPTLTVLYVKSAKKATTEE